jgi:hypothetical protein
LYGVKETDETLMELLKERTHGTAQGEDSWRMGLLWGSDEECARVCNRVWRVCVCVRAIRRDGEDSWSIEEALLLRGNGVERHRPCAVNSWSFDQPYYINSWSFDQPYYTGPLTSHII